MDGPIMLGPPNESVWSSLQQDISELKRGMSDMRRELKADLVALAATKQDLGVSDQRWKDIWGDIAEVKSELKNRPQQQTQNIFQALGCSLNGLIAIAAVGSTFLTLAAVVISLIALLR